MAAVIEILVFDQIIVAHRVPAARPHIAYALALFCRHSRLCQNRKGRTAAPQRIQVRVGLIALCLMLLAELPILLRKERLPHVHADVRTAVIASDRREHFLCVIPGRRHDDADCLFFRLRCPRQPGIRPQRLLQGSQGEQYQQDPQRLTYVSPAPLSSVCRHCSPLFSCLISLLQASIPFRSPLLKPGCPSQQRVAPTMRLMSVKPGYAHPCGKRF